MDDKAVWDDSALVDSWNEALEEYKKYHSIHAKGGSVKDLLAEESSRGRPTASKCDDHVAGTPAAVALEGGDEDQAMSTNGEKAEKDTRPGRGDPALHDGTNQVPVAFSPQAVMGSIQDESLKRLMMSWYYAGYYTGLYEGEQKAQKQLNEQ
ncbi:hypothetical protein JDV02_002586 [Purpureocillium takamizusanense]|uniref:Survival motor neuron Tudor domain-containing protein n=1 Tax=Purpureocillium takamizusanense TaxID=2060973 RepID=A0A9Q8Q9N8_9HYPO|nr:uncharacterized protein JDV02_002586 [Purpureocillium takamizusanense]UNI16118.1 hypothetical protein JDV02_002586 [Purpureocillium takamizusanense]